MKNERVHVPAVYVTLVPKSNGKTISHNPFRIHYFNCLYTPRVRKVWKLFRYIYPNTLFIRTAGCPMRTYIISKRCEIMVLQNSVWDTLK